MLWLSFILQRYHVTDYHSHCEATTDLVTYDLVSVDDQDFSQAS